MFRYKCITSREHKKPRLKPVANGKLHVQGSTVCSSSSVDVTFLYIVDINRIDCVSCRNWPHDFRSAYSDKCVDYGNIL